MSSSSNLIQERISQFILNNDNGEVNDSTLWESLIAVIRGHIISYASNKSKKESERLKEIEQDLNKILLAKTQQKYFELGDKRG